MPAPYRVHFVCTGNICRSPMAAVITRSMLVDAGLDGTVSVDSSGTGQWHVGGGADPRALRALSAHGYDGSSHRARQFDPIWFADLDLVLALDRGHQRTLRSQAGRDADRDKVRLLREFDERSVAAGQLDVEDPWYGDRPDFDECFEVVEAACSGLVEWLSGRGPDQAPETPHRPSTTADTV